MTSGGTHCNVQYTALYCAYYALLSKIQKKRVDGIKILQKKLEVGRCGHVTVDSQYRVCRRVDGVWWRAARHGSWCEVQSWKLHLSCSSTERQRPKLTMQRWVINTVCPFLPFSLLPSLPSLILLSSLSLSLPLIVMLTYSLLPLSLYVGPIYSGIYDWEACYCTVAAKKG